MPKGKAKAKAKRKTTPKPKCGTDQMVKVHSTGQRFKDIHINGFKKCEPKPEEGACVRLKHAELQLVSEFATGSNSLKKDTVDLKRLPCLQCAQMLYSTNIYQYNIELDPETEEDDLVRELLASRSRLDFEGDNERQHSGDSTVASKPKRSKALSK